MGGGTEEEQANSELLLLPLSGKEAEEAPFAQQPTVRNWYRERWKALGAIGLQSFL